MKIDERIWIHPSADISPSAKIGTGSTVWNQAQIREHAVLGEQVIIGKNVYIGPEVEIGDYCKVQNNASIFNGVILEGGVFIGPHVCFTNDRLPRAINPDGSQKAAADWNVMRTIVRYGASIGAHSVILPGIEVGSFAMVGAGSVVTDTIEPHALVVGNPTRVIGWVCKCGRRLTQKNKKLICTHCGFILR